jgi:hypothetical protein
MSAMDDLRKLEAKGLARAKIRSKRRRTSAIRQRTFRGSMALFLVLWAVIFGQLVTGNDPALSRVHRAVKQPTAHRSAPPTEAESAAATVEPEVQAVPEAETESSTEGEPEAALEREAAPRPVPAPEPSPPVVTSSS